MKYLRHVVLVGMLGLLAVVTSGADAQSSGGSYRVEPVLVGGAGGTATGGGFTLHGSFGQAATKKLDASAFELVGGFWAANPPAPNDIIFANGFDGGTP